MSGPGGDILRTIIDHKRTEVAAARQHTPIDLLRRQAETAAPPKAFVTALASAAAAKKPGVIAEVKKASPSKGVIRENFDPVAIAASYSAHGATCLSVLTDQKFFQGHDDYLRAVREAVDLPIIRKDFIVDEYQLYEARAMGADCVLLIVAALDIMQLTNLNQAARGLGLDVLIEVHNTEELKAALSLKPRLIGINNRNLKTFHTSLNTTLDMLEAIPGDVTVVTESGISSKQDVATMLEHEVYCFLVGEAFMREDDPGVALENLFSQ